MSKMLDNIFLCRFDKQTNGLFFGWLCFIAFLASVPYLYALSQAGVQESYNWLLPPYPEDGLSYFAWVEQAAGGNLLLKMKYTAKEHASFLFQPYFLMVGWFEGITGLGSGISLFWARIGSLFLFLTATGHFLQYLQFTRRQFWLSLLFLTLSSGFGWMFKGGKPADLWMPEINTLWSISWSAIFPIAYLFIVLAIMWFSWALEEDDHIKKRNLMIGSGAMVGLLVFIHPYDIVFTIFVLAVIGLLRIRQWRLFGWFIAVAGLPIALQFILSRLHPVLATHSSAEMLSPPLISYLKGVGLPGILALVGCFIVFAKKELWRARSLVYWLVGAFALAYLPIWFQSKMIGGVHIPISILAAVALDKGMQIVGVKNRVSQSLVVAIVLLCTMPSHLENFKMLRSELAGNRNYYYIDNDLKEAFNFLKENTSPEDVVLADLKVSSLIPGESGNTVVYGHWAQSIDAGERMQLLGSFLYRTKKSDGLEKQKSELKKIGARYILVDPAMRYSFGNGNVERILTLGKTVFSNEKVKIVLLD